MTVYTLNRSFNITFLATSSMCEIAPSLAIFSGASRFRSVIIAEASIAVNLVPLSGLAMCGRRFPGHSPAALVFAQHHGAPANFARLITEARVAVLLDGLIRLTGSIVGRSGGAPQCRACHQRARRHSLFRAEAVVAAVLVHETSARRAIAELRGRLGWRPRISADDNGHNTHGGQQQHDS